MNYNYKLARVKLILETEKESFDKIVRDQAPIICAKLNYTYEKK